MHEADYDITPDAEDVAHGGHSIEEHGTLHHEDTHLDAGEHDATAFGVIHPHHVDVSGWEVPGVLAAHFDASLNNEEIIGHPLEDMEHWHQQSYPDTCAVVSQEFVLSELTGHHYSEEQLRDEALQHGLYATGGTPPDAVGGLLELHGIPVVHEYNATLNDLRAELDAGHKVIVGVDADEIWYHQQDGHTPLTETSMMGGRGINHALQVIGYDPETQSVILNDPGCADGRGEMVPADQFMQAWAEGNNLMVHTVDSRGDEVRLGDRPWERWGAFVYETNPDGSYTGNWGTP